MTRIPKEELLQATMLALTRQNVVGDSSDQVTGLIGDVAIYTEGWNVQTPPIYGDFDS